MLSIVIATVTKNITPSTIAKFRSFLISEINAFSPDKKGTSSAVTMRRIALTAKSKLKSWKAKGGSNIVTLPYDTLWLGFWYQGLKCLFGLLPVYPRLWQLRMRKHLTKCIRFARAFGVDYCWFRCKSC